MSARVVDYLVQAVASLGVRHIFGVGGANIEDLYDAIYDAGGPVTGVVAKHEFAAATMADGYARTGAQLGVVCATSGGGAMNLVAGLAESFASRVPVLALVGQPTTALAGHGAFQDSSGLAGSFDATALYTPISRYCARVDDPVGLPGHLGRAVTVAHLGGVAVLLLPKDVQQAELNAPAFVPQLPQRRIDRAGLNRVRATLLAARATGKIAIIAGDQVARDDARSQLLDLATVLDAAVGVVPEAKDAFDCDAAGFCGVAGSMGHPELIDAVGGAALCLLVGTRLPVAARAGLDEALAGTSVASVGAEAPYPDSLHATSTDLAAALADLAAGCSSGEPDGPDRPSVTPPTVTPLPVPPVTGPGLSYRDIVETLGAVLEPGSDVFADAGNTGAATVHHLRLPRDGRFVVALGMGGMGYAFGAGIGSAFARQHRPDGGLRRTVVVAGDGAFYMHGLEIHTAIEHRLPVTFVVCNNNAHAMCVTREQLYYGDRYSYNRFRPAQLGAGLAAMFPDLPTFTPDTTTELAAALRRCFATSGPSFVCIDCDPDEIPPFTPFLSVPRRHP
ncbi:thiamine pyrophosphate-binding protein [Streptomyces piniterrae]|uniref:Thiamine pyrophosphate-binding protein n=1 Tax=Streptomyces piniterrae TaxID=2571125 RepID=A0A4U0NJ67_9ACTN|nr:thiamine pyrophosphate-binding protein [Streptomyces piniterrae]TJZ54335.1 thiamine pyrophosphate-binding protein [Streptomyces piniterrae]